MKTLRFSLRANRIGRIRESRSEEQLRLNSLEISSEEQAKKNPRECTDGRLKDGCWSAPVEPRTVGF